MLLASVLDNGDAAVLAEAPGVTDAGSVHALLAQLMQHAPVGPVPIRIVTTPDATALDEAQWAVRALSAAGYPVDAIVVTRVPLARDGWPRAWADPQRDRVETLARTSPVPVIPLRLRPQRRVVPRTMPTEQVRAVPVTPAPQPTGAGFAWHVTVDGIAQVRRLAIGQDGGALVIDMDGTVVRRALPAVLARCIATSAEETETGVTVAFIPDPQAWPQERA